jgi:hypothetical protein
MVSFGMLRCVVLVRTDVSEERIASIIRVTKIDELGTTPAVTSSRRCVRPKRHQSSTAGRFLGWSRTECNIKMDPLEIGVSVVDWIGLAQDRYRWRALVNSAMNLRVP